MNPVLMNLDPKNVWWLTPSHGGIPHDSHTNTREWMRHKVGISVCPLRELAEINSARSKLANMALNGLEHIGPPAEVLLWVDADNAPDPKICLDLIKRAAETKGMHSASYARKTSDLVEPGVRQSICMAADEPLVLTPGQGYPVKLVGFGCVAIHRRVFNRVKPLVPLVEWDSGNPAEDGPHYFMPEMVGKKYKHDDAIFCRRVVEAGLHPWLWPAHRVVHWKTLGLMPPAGEVVVDEGGTVMERRDDTA